MLIFVQIKCNAQNATILLKRWKIKLTYVWHFWCWNWKKKQNKINCQSTNCLVFHTHPLAKTYYFIEKIEFNLFCYNYKKWIPIELNSLLNYDWHVTSWDVLKNQTTTTVKSCNSIKLYEKSNITTVNDLKLILISMIKKFGAWSL